MKFGSTRKERLEAWKAPQGTAWTKWFAWYPVELKDDGSKIWWEEVEYRYWGGYTFNIPEYRRIK
jgi:hypothetical protein